jgi:hypothetical protein
VEFHQFVATGSHLGGPTGSSTNTTGSGSGRSQQASQLGHNGKGPEGCSEIWLEVGSVSFGPLVVEAAISLPSPQHSLHLVQHK